MPRKEENKTNIKTATSLNVKKANEFIHAVSNASLLANKIMLYALLQAKEIDGCCEYERPYYEYLKKKTFTDYSTGLIAVIDVPTLKTVLGDTSGSFYKRVAELMDINSEHSLLNQWRLIINDKNGDLSGSVNIIQSTVYDREIGKLFIKFSNETEIKKRVVSIKRNYTPLSIPTMMSLKSVYSYRLYEMLVSRIGFDDFVSHSPCESYTFDFGVSELRYKIGTLDTSKNSDLCSDLAKASTADDYEQIERKYSAHGQLARFQVFETTLKKAVNELNDLPEHKYTFSYRTNRSGHGGRITSLTFIVSRNEDNAVLETNIPIGELYDDEEKVNPISNDEIRGILKTAKLTDKDCMDIAEAAGYNIDAIKQVSKVMDSSPVPIKSIVAFAKVALKNDFQVPIAKETQESLLSGYDRAHRDRQGIMHENIDYDEIVRQRVLSKL